MTEERADVIMGGRGGASGFPANAPVPAAPQSAADTKDLAELSQYMSDTHGIRVDTATLTSSDFENVKNAAAAIETVIREFPQAAANFHELKGGPARNGVMARASYSGKIQLADYYYNDRNTLMGRYAASVQRGGSPAGTTGDHVATHESGHILERALIDKYVNSQGSDFTTRMAASNAWGKCTYAAKVVSEACKDAKKTPGGKGLKNADLIKGVSRYATQNRSETLAECVADYTANGSSAKPLSVAVWNILKRELG